MEVTTLRAADVGLWRAYKRGELVAAEQRPHDLVRRLRALGIRGATTEFVKGPAKP